jgi:hypothetical protein
LFWSAQPPTNHLFCLRNHITNLFCLRNKPQLRFSIANRIPNTIYY